MERAGWLREKPVVDIDQSQQMLLRANDKFPGQRTERMSLQEIAFMEASDGIICADATEFIAPEDCPLSSAISPAL